MARTKEFDPEQAVDAALSVFWQRGYAETSVQDLVDALGVNRGSLYATFGSKHSLFISALEKYCQEAPDGLFGSMGGQAPVESRLRSGLAHLLESDVANGRGCFLINSAMETLPTDSDTAEIFDRTRRRMTAEFEELLREAESAHRLTEGTSAARGADYLFTLLQGLRVMAKASRDLETVLGALDLGLAAIFRP